MLRIGQIQVDSDVPFGGHKATNVQSIMFAGGGEMTAPPGPGSIQPATSSTLGGVIVSANGLILDVSGNGLVKVNPGDGLQIDGGTGKLLLKLATGGGLSINGSGELFNSGSAYSLPTASDTVLGGLRIGTGVAAQGLVMVGQFLTVKLGANMSIDGSGALQSTASGGGGGTVTSVNGNAGPAVTITINEQQSSTTTFFLATADIPESGSATVTTTGCYFTNARAVAALAGQAIAPSQLQCNNIFGSSQIIINSSGGVAVEGGNLMCIGHNIVSDGTVSGAGIISTNGFLYSGTARLDIQKTAGGYAQVWVGEMQLSPASGNAIIGAGVGSTIEFKNFSGNDCNLIANSLTTSGTVKGGTFYTTGGVIFVETGGNPIFFEQGTNGAFSDYADVKAKTYRASGSNNLYNDLAEYTPAPSNATLPEVERLTAAEVAVIDPNNDEAVCRHAGAQYDRTVAGVVSTSPAYAIGHDPSIPDERHPEIPLGDPAVPLALAGRVPTKVTTKYVKADSTVVARPIHKGDILVSSSINGHAMAADPSDCPNGTIPPGSIIGKAMQDWAPATGDAQEGTIKVWVNLG